MTIWTPALQKATAVVGCTGAALAFGAACGAGPTNVAGAGDVTDEAKVHDHPASNGSWRTMTGTKPRDTDTLGDTTRTSTLNTRPRESGEEEEDDDEQHQRQQEPTMDKKIDILH